VAVTFRLFVALEPPGPLRRQLAALAAELRRLGGRAAAEVRWVPPEQIHLTLQFLGNAPEERLPEVQRAVEQAAAAAAPLHLLVRGAGGFPSARRPRVLWAGVEGDLAPLAGLARELGRSLAPLGFPPEERPFSPHLTLGRAGEGVPGLAGALAAVRDRDLGTWRAAEITLFRSHLSAAGARHEPLSKAAMGGGTSEAP